MKVAYFLPDATSPFWKEVVAGAEKRGLPNRVTLEVVSCHHDASEQLAQLRAYASYNPDALFVSPVNEKGILPLCKAALDSGKPVIAIDSNLAGMTASIISGNVKGGALAAAYIADKKGAGAKVVHIKAEEHLQNVRQRSSGFVGEAAKRGLTIVGAIQADSRRELARVKMAELLESRLPFDAIFAENDDMAIGAIAAIEAAGLAPYPMIVGYDGTAEARALIRSKKMDASVAQDAMLLGERAVEALIAATTGNAVQKLVMLLPYLLTAADVK